MSVTDEPAGKGARREALLAEAARQLNARGVTQSSLTDIADTLSISRAALYHYVDDRQDLVFQCYRRSCENLAQHLDRATRKSANALDALADFISMALEGGSDEFAAISEIGLLQPEQRDTIQALYLGLAARLSVIIEGGMRKKTVRSCDAGIVAYAILGMVFWIPVSRRWSIAVSDVARSLAVSTLVEVVKQGISASRATPTSIPKFDLSPLLPSGAGIFDRAFMNRSRRDALLTAASQLFNQKGVSATSLEEIAAAAGATKRAILHHFGDKMTLVGACYRRAYDVFIHIGIEAGNHPGPRTDGLAGAWAALCEANLREGLRPLTPLVGFESLDGATQADLDARSRELSSLYQKHLAIGHVEKSLREFDDNAFLLVVSGAFNWLTKNIVTFDEVQADRMGGEIAALIMIGLEPVE